MASRQCIPSTWTENLFQRAAHSPLFVPEQYHQTEPTHNDCSRRKERFCIQWNSEGSSHSVWHHQNYVDPQSSSPASTWWITSHDWRAKSIHHHQSSWRPLIEQPKGPDPQSNWRAWYKHPDYRQHSQLFSKSKRANVYELYWNCKKVSYYNNV